MLSYDKQDTWSTYRRSSRSRLPFYVRRLLIGYTVNILSVGWHFSDTFRQSYVMDGMKRIE